MQHEALPAYTRASTRSLLKRKKKNLAELLVPESFTLLFLRDLLLEHAHFLLEPGHLRARIHVRQVRYEVRGMRQHQVRYEV